MRSGARGEVLSLLAAFVLAAGVVPRSGGEVSPAAGVPWGEPEQVVSGFQFTEGPVWHEDGYLLFSDVQGNRIGKWTPPATIETFRSPSGQSNGLAFDDQGRLVACEHGNRRISRTESDGRVVTLAGSYDGSRLNSPNDLALKSDGSIYFTDPPYGISPSQQELPFNGVFRLPPGGELTLLATDFNRPNGVAFSPDESKVYIADTTGGHVRVFDVQPDGTLAGGAVFVQVSSPDGMKVDRKGNLYVASSVGVVVFTPKGETIGIIAFPQQPSNCCFGDADGNTLYVTARTAVYRVRLTESEILLDSKRNVRITWRSVSNKSYRVYQSSDAVVWTLAAENVPSAEGLATTWTDPTKPLLSSEIPRRYYRVIESE